MAEAAPDAGWHFPNRPLSNIWVGGGLSVRNKEIKNLFLDEIHLGMYCNCDVDVDFGIGVYAIVKNQDGRDDDVNMARDDLHIDIDDFSILQKGNCKLLHI